jgi:hypothetical protein
VPLETVAVLARGAPLVAGEDFGAVSVLADGETGLFAGTGADPSSEVGTGMSSGSGASELNENGQVHYGRDERTHPRENSAKFVCRNENATEIKLQEGARDRTAGGGAVVVRTEPNTWRQSTPSTATKQSGVLIATFLTLTF